MWLRRVPHQTHNKYLIIVNDICYYSDYHITSKYQKLIILLLQIYSKFLYKTFNIVTAKPRYLISPTFKTAKSAESWLSTALKGLDVSCYTYELVKTHKSI